MTDKESLCLALRENPCWFRPWEVLADLFEDEGDPDMTKTLRWMARHLVLPLWWNFLDNPPGSVWSWGGCFPHRKPFRHFLPAHWLELMPRTTLWYEWESPENHLDHHRLYKCPVEAASALSI